MQLGTRPKAQVDAGFENGTRGFADAGVALQEWQTRESQTQE